MNMIGKLVKFFRIISKLGYKNLINTQIGVYNKLKRRYPEASENDLLNMLIISRISSVPLPKVGFIKEFAHYKPILDDSNKTLESVIWAIAKYEYFESGYAKSRNQKYRIPDWFLDEMKQKIRDYIRKAVEESIKENIEFRNFKRDYKNFLWIFFIEILFVVLLKTTLFQNTNLLLRPPISFSLNLLAGLFSLVLLFYTVRIIMNAFKVFKTIKPSKIQIGFLYFLLCLFLFINFFSPLIIGMYVIHLMNKYKQMNES